MPKKEVVTTDFEARSELTANRSKPDWRDRRHSLPFSELSPDEFEIFCFLLLKREFPNDNITYYAGTGDGGRDIMHRRVTSNGTIIRLIQCKRYDHKVTIETVREHMAKVWVNVFNGTIPERPDEIVLYVVPDLTSWAKNLIDSQSVWRKSAKKALRKYLKTPVSADLLRHASEWWPISSSESALVLTERAEKFKDLIEEFFSIRKVIAGDANDVASVVCERVVPPIMQLGERLTHLERVVVSPLPLVAATAEDLKLAFARCSTDLLKWPTTLSGDLWLDRPELQILLDRFSSESASVNVVLGPPGSGKSAILARFCQHIVSQGITVLAIKADQLRSVIDTSAKLAERLGLSVLAEQAVRSVAQTERVVVVLDQLDALADLADLKSERLHVLLDLIDSLSTCPNVRIVCSSREFEYQNDKRLSRRNPEPITLVLPSWELVAPVLATHGVIADNWPEDAKELLRVPYHLKLFLKRLEGGGEHLIFRSLQQLFNELWQEQVVRPGGGRANLLHDLAERLADQEELWIDRGRFDDRWNTVDSLIAADILSLTNDGFRVGFRHQTLFEFTRARTFALPNASLSAYVLERQDALFARPTLWMALNYLRNACNASYRREFNLLSDTPSLRHHVKHLLIDFVAQVEQPLPEDWEQTWMVTALHDKSWRHKVLTAMTGKQVWFRLFAETQFSAEMQKSFAEAKDLVWVLVAAWTFERDLCLSLMENYWLPEDSKLPLAWHGLAYLDDWTERSVELAIAIVRRTDIDQGRMWQMAQRMTENAPLLAVRLVSAWIDSARRRIVLKANEGTDDRQDHLRKILNNPNDWHEIDELAERVPAEFVKLLWPHVCDITMSQQNRPSECVIEYSSGWIDYARIDRREYAEIDSPDEFFMAFDKAMRQFSRTCPGEFINLVRETGHLNSKLLQRLICRAVRELVSTNPTFAFDYLMADRRRFRLGWQNDELGDSIDLIISVAAYLTADQFEQLTNAVRTWEMYHRPGDGDNDEHSVYTRGYRLRLLASLPIEHLPEIIKREIKAERFALPGYVQSARVACKIGMNPIKSPVSQTEMASMTNAGIARLFEDLPDLTESRHPNDWMKGGSVQASQELENFTKLCPCRALVVLEMLRPVVQERPASHVIRGLIASNYPIQEVIALIQSLDSRGFTGQDFRETVASALNDPARDNGLSDAACELLDHWRLGVWTNYEQGENLGKKDSSEVRVSSILWQFRGYITLPHGRFSVLAALTRGYLCRKPYAADRWLDMLRSHVELDESLAVWKAMCLYLADVRICTNRDGAIAFLERLLERFPEVLNNGVGVHMLAHVAQILPKEVRWQAYETVRKQNSTEGQQAFGELVCLRLLIDPNDCWARKQIEAAFVAPTESDHEQVLIGVAFAAANLWTDQACHFLASDILLRLIPLPSKKIGYAAMTAFQRQETLTNDRSTLAVFQSVADNPDILILSDSLGSFFDHLLDIFIVDKGLVCRISHEAVRLLGAELSSGRHSLDMANSTLIDIALRLQRSIGHFRQRGMELFESLLDLGVSEAIHITHSKDLRLIPGGTPRRALRRRRSRTPV